MRFRSSGVLLHVSSIPSEFGIGDFGPWAYRFIDLLEVLGQSYWQLLPLGPSSPALGNSPYSSFSAFAGNYMLLSPEWLSEEGYLPAADLSGAPQGDPGKVNYEEVETYKLRILREAYERSRFTLEQDKGYSRFCEQNAHWLDDWALFITLKEHFNGRVWSSWPEEYRDRRPGALDHWRVEGGDSIRFAKFLQFLFYKQWFKLKAYAQRRGVRIVGDAPIYVTYDSADTWTNPRLFKLDHEKMPLYVAGVPPDYFSVTGQRWGNPVYDWEAMKKEGFSWWQRRISHNLALYDFIRLDHFRGFSAYWEIDASEETAVRGKWIEAPGVELFRTLLRKFPCLPIIAEDLGYITADVRELKNTFELPGMKVLQFGFSGGADNPDAPHNHEKNCVVYTGTHDNNTTRGWFMEELSSEDRANLMEYAGKHLTEEDAPLELVRVAMKSVCDTAIFPMQDLLALPSWARMNTPSKGQDNWRWRIRPEEMTAGRLEFFGRWTRFFGRSS